MMKKIRISRLAAQIQRSLLAVFPLVLGACTPDSIGNKEIFIEAVPTDSSLFGAGLEADRKGDIAPLIQLDFDQSPYFITPSSSLLYRGNQPSYVREHGYLSPGSLLFANRTNASHGPLLVLPPLEVGRAYNASVWIKLYDTDQASNARLVWARISDGTITLVPLAEVHVEPRTWQKLEGEFIDSNQSSTDINTLSVEVDNVDIKYLIDDLMITYAELSAELQAAAASAKKVSTEIIVNGDVEQGLEPWTHQGGVISRSSAHAHSGKYSVLIAGRKQEWHAPMMPLSGLKDNTFYRFSVYARLNEGEPDSQLRLTIRRKTAGQTTFTPLGGNWVRNTEWTEVVGTFASGNISDSENVAVYLEAENPTASYFVDTLTVQEIRPE